MEAPEARSKAWQQHQLIHELFVLLDDGDRRLLGATRLSPLEFAVLQRLDTSHGQRLTDIGVALLCVKSTITRLVDRLELDGLVQRTPDPEDRRAQRLLLTRRGLTVRDQARHAYVASVERRLSGLDDEEQAQLCHLLAKLRDLLRADLDST
jgi:DNA-binding MarR family transcriptional regulator